MKLGFIGMGNMGGPMCRNLIKHDHQVALFDKNPATLKRFVGHGGQAAGSAKEVAAAAEIVFTSLPLPADVEEVALGPGGIAEGAHDGLIYVDLSTNAPSVVRKVAAELKGRGIAMLDAPVSGGVAGAEAGTIAVMVGGDKEVFDKVEPLFKCIGKNVFHVGGHGTGCIAKLVNNMIAFCNLTASIEGFLLGVQAGVEPKMLHQIVAASSGNSFILRLLPEKILAGNFDADFSLDLAHKDLRLALQLGEEAGVPLHIGSYIVNLMRQATAKGYGSNDLSVLARVLEDAAGKELRA